MLKVLDNTTVLQQYLEKKALYDKLDGELRQMRADLIEEYGVGTHIDGDFRVGVFACVNKSYKMSEVPAPMLKALEPFQVLSEYNRVTVKKLK